MQFPRRRPPLLTATLVLLIVLAVLSLKVSAAENKVIFKVGYDLQAPHRFTDINGKAAGTDIERVKKIFEHTDIELEFYEFPWKRILKLIETGKLDVALSAANIPQRRKFAYFSTEVFKFGTNKLFVNNKFAAQYPNFKSLKEITSTDLLIAIRQSASYSDEYDILIQNQKFKNRLLHIRTVAHAIRLVQKGRIDAIITNQEILEWELLRGCHENQFYSPYDLSAVGNSSSYLMFSKQTVSQSQVEKVNNAMKLVKPSELNFDISHYQLSNPC